MPPSTVQRSPERPPPLPDRQGCSRFVGRASGNDPSVEIELVLCGDTALTGELQWSSLTSGWNRRAVSGQRQGERIVLRDDAILEENPTFGWRFCDIERYDLTLDGDALSGTYEAPSCNDSATLTLTSAGEAPAPTAAPPAPEPMASPSGCAGCTAIGFAPSLLLLVVTLLAYRKPQP